MPYTFEPYDILQCKRRGEWVDFSTLRTVSDKMWAEDLVRGGMWDGAPLAFRIVRNVIGEGKTPVFAVVPMRYRWNAKETMWEYYGDFGWRGCTNTPRDEVKGREFLTHQHIERAAVVEHRPDPECNYLVFES